MRRQERFELTNPLIFLPYSFHKGSYILEAYHSSELHDGTQFVQASRNKRSRDEQRTQHNLVFYTPATHTEGNAPWAQSVLESMIRIHLSSSS